MENTKKKTIVVSIIGLIFFVIGFGLFMLSFTIQRSSIIFVNDDDSVIQVVPTAVGKSRSATDIDVEFSSTNTDIPRGYVAQFRGWILPGATRPVQIVDMMEEKDITVKASYEVVKCEYKIDYGGGTSSHYTSAESKKKITKFFIDTESFELPSPIRKTKFNGTNHFGYTFAGWDITSTTTEEKLFKLEKGAYDTNLSLMAKWVSNEYEIVYETSAYNLINENELIYGYTTELGIKELPTPNKTGYIFIGWHMNEDLSDAAFMSIPAGKTGTINLYAEWKAKEYKISYSLNGGSFEGVTPTLVYTIESETFNLPVPTKEGYTFAGWFVKNNFAGEPITEITKGSTGDRTLYAKWEENE